MADHTEWVEDLKAAHKHAQLNPRRLKDPPHWLRCSYMKNGVRCVKGIDHHGTPHEEPK